jgi:GTP-binding protein
MQNGKISLNSAKYLAAAHLKTQWPEPEGPEVAFAGRSNVGKSSAINAITNHRGLAKTSKTPGRTQQIVFFELDAGQRLVDLPGYGYAKVPVDVRRYWEKIIMEYLQTRDPLQALILPMDVRRPFMALDQQMLEWCTAVELPVYVLLTKADKLSRNKADAALHALRKEVSRYSVKGMQLFSAPKKQGVDTARSQVVDFLSMEHVSERKKTPA